MSLEQDRWGDRPTTSPSRMEIDIALAPKAQETQRRLKAEFLARQQRRS